MNVCPTPTEPCNKIWQVLRSNFLSIAGIHQANFEITHVDSTPTMVVYLSGPASVSLMHKPPKWVPGDVKLVAVSSPPDRATDIPIWTQTALTTAQSALASLLPGQRIHLVQQPGRGHRSGSIDYQNTSLSDRSASESFTQQVWGHALSDNQAISDGGPLVLPQGFAQTLTQALLGQYCETSKLVVYAGGQRTGEYTYTDLIRQAMRVANGLKANGATQGQTILISCQDAHTAVLGLLACLLAGFLAAPLDPPKNEEDEKGFQRLRSVLDLLKRPPMVVHPDESWREHASKQLQDSTPEFWEITALTQAERDQVRHTPDAFDPALLLLTSGSTGTPKAVIQSHRGILSMIAAVHCHHLKIDSNDVMFNWMPRDHVGAQTFTILAALVTGASQVHADTHEILIKPARWLDIIEAEKVTITWSPNFAYELIAREANKLTPSDKLSSLRYIVNGGEAVTEHSLCQSVEVLKKYGLRDVAVMVPSLGMSETATAITLGRLASMIGPFSNLGAAVSGTRIRITGIGGDLLKEGEIGAVEVLSPQLFNGYLGLPSPFKNEGWFDTGDSGFIFNGELFLTGRLKDTINAHGLSVYPQEIENCLFDIPGIDTNCVTAVSVRPPSSVTDEVAIFFATHPAEGLNHPDITAAIAKAIEQQLRQKQGLSANYLVPLHPKAYPRTGIGKIIRRDLKQQLEEGLHHEAIATLRVRMNEASSTIPVHRSRWVALESIEGDQAHDLAPAKHPGLLMTTGAVQKLDGQLIPEQIQNNCTPTTIRSTIDAHRDALAQQTLILFLDAASPRPYFNYDCIVALADALENLPEDERPLQVLVISGQTCHVFDQDEPAPDNTTLTGLTASLNQYSVQTRWRLIDTDSNDLDVILNAKIIQGFEPVTVLRRGNAYVPRLQPVEQHHFASTRKSHGLWVVAGGLGGVGRALCERLLQQNLPLLILGQTPESELDTEKQSLFAQLKSKGTVLYADMRDPTDLPARFEAACAQFKENLAGVIQATGVHVDGFIPSSGEQFKTGWNSTIGVLDILSTALQAWPDVPVTIVNSVVGLIGARMASYCAMHGALAERAIHYRKQGRPVSLLALSAVESTGLSQGRTNQSLLQAQGLLMLNRQAAATAIDQIPHNEFWLTGIEDLHPQHAWRVLQRPAPLVTMIAWNDVHDGAMMVQDACATPTWIELRRIPSHARRADGSVDETRLLSPGETSVLDQPADSTAQVLTYFFAQELELENYSESEDFFFKGGNSISATRLAAELSEWFFMPVPVAALFQHPTPRSMATYLRAHEPQPSLIESVTEHLLETMESGRGHRGLADTATIE